ncbi:glycoside hydrolase family 18 protein [Trichoderma atroviride IMI 206040]|uniref:Glycoside hydrolase family 18 protein n=1 Tax=Hypocrea atroviridis (strain ATCC 20476 / IMI 206040) TaxID=452589 RepID=G9NLM0_HYPAI|nr:glycoside hydrolase family 18 protein [Trichoderma atroviride IMI 206040]EHK48782.1 glycoside hydrolase family 18 protein [Trichoderma atroviride IMI 206040]
MNADQIPTGYTHVNFAFTKVSQTYQVDISGMEDEWGLLSDRRGSSELYPLVAGPSVPIRGIDGVDIDLEYSGEPDIQSIPSGSSLRVALLSGISLSIAATASYWYLQGFPIADIASVVNYIIYMTSHQEDMMYHHQFSLLQGICWGKTLPSPSFSASSNSPRPKILSRFQRLR